MPATAPKMRFAHFSFDPVKDLLGEGPLSEVYKAEDENLGRTVALKILRAHVELDPEADRRFEREARHTSHLAHPNIATIYEYGEDSGRRYIAMEYLQGRTLDKIIKDGQLSIDEVVRISQQVCEALALVHEHGLIHRDLKPANVMVQNDGSVKLLDFGIARKNGESTITQHGMLVGTVLYMSPEQVRGDELDVRSDIFALGALFYHALTGALPFPGSSFPEVCMAILDGAPRPPSQVRPGVPQALEDFIMKCLAPDPADRFPHAGAAKSELDILTSGRAAAANHLSGTLAIARLECASGDDELAAGLRKDLSAELARAGLTVTLADDAKAYGRCDFALKGLITVASDSNGEGLQGTLQLVLEKPQPGDNGRNEIWRESLSGTEADEWALQAQLVRTAVRALRRTIADQAFRSQVYTKRDPEGARRTCQKAHEILHRGLTRHLVASMSMFRRALEADPRCALAFSGLSEALVRKYLYWDGDESYFNEARDYARRALAFDPSCAEAHTALGFGYMLAGLAVDAQREYRRAIQLDSKEWLAHRLLGALLSREGNFKAASPLLQRAIALRPGYISSYDHHYKVLQRLDRYQEAIETADLGIAEARKQIARAEDDQDSRLHLALLYARLGRSDPALIEVSRALEVGKKDGFTAFHAAQVHAILGNREQALEFLIAAQQRGYCIRTEQRSSEFDLLRGMPQFEQLVA